MTRMIPGRPAAVAALALTLLAGCETIGNPLDVIATRTEAPDEFQVIARKPLRMPASLSLPAPRPGAPSPLDPTPQRDAAVALLGADVRAVARAPSAGEQALLAAADAAAADPSIRQTLAAERQAGGDAPYEPPLIWELFGLGGEAAPQDVIDPAAEARRLQSQGIAAPVDPDYRPAEAEVVVENPNVYPEMGIDRAPRNNLPSSAPVPAF